jgi:hypothetical protein
LLDFAPQIEGHGGVECLHPVASWLEGPGSLAGLDESEGLKDAVKQLVSSEMNVISGGI